MWDMMSRGWISPGTRPPTAQRNRNTGGRRDDRRDRLSAGVVRCHYHVAFFGTHARSLPVPAEGSTVAETGRRAGGGCSELCGDRRPEDLGSVEGLTASLPPVPFAGNPEGAPRETWIRHDSPEELPLEAHQGEARADAGPQTVRANDRPLLFGTRLCGCGKEGGKS